MEVVPTDFAKGLPESLTTILNAIAFLVAATGVWYAYFIKGKKAATQAAQEVDVASKHLVVSPIDGQLIVTMSANMERVANALEQVASIMQHNQTEAEIERRVREQLLHMKDIV